MKKRINITIPEHIHEELIEYTNETKTKISALITKWTKLIIGKFVEVPGFKLIREKSFKGQLFTIKTEGFTLEGLLSGAYLVGDEKVKKILKDNFSELIKI